MTYDLIIVSQSTPEMIPVTQACIDSARQDNAQLNIIIVETGSLWTYDGVDNIIKYSGSFNYNRALNFGLKYAKSDITILANNDIVFHKGWSDIGGLMLSNGYHSASILSQNDCGFKRGNYVYEGYVVGKHLTGWCIFLDKYCLDKIRPLDETCSFWYSDDLYACQLKQAGIKHAIFCNMQVDHLTSRTLVRQNQHVQRRFQMGELGKFKIRQKYYAEGITKRVNAVNSKNL